MREKETNSSYKLRDATVDLRLAFSLGGIKRLWITTSYLYVPLLRPPLTTGGSSGLHRWGEYFRCFFYDGCSVFDLQSEIESHRDVFSSLNGTGRKLLSSLASQDDAVMLQRRLDEMNQRWHHLKAKSMAIR
uniref:Dystrophin n=1 Tax=Timema bartmani TaxID=61472 RepID=A0A7R9EX04_9NEOP|nr:unnamed protein product [Timema bartmani]